MEQPLAGRRGEASIQKKPSEAIMHTGNPITAGMNRQSKTAPRASSVADNSHNGNNVSR